MSSIRNFMTLALLCAMTSISIPSDEKGKATSAEVTMPKPGAKPVEFPGLPNVIHVTDKFLNGACPEGDEGFESLKKLGIKTILSVDGAQPDLMRAKKFGLKYVHMPIGYDGVSQDQAEKLAKAIRDLPGPIYLHCHHGKHRSAGAAAAIVTCLDEKCSATQAIEIMKRAGTDPRYAGLYGAPKVLRRPTKAELDALPIEYVEAVKVPPMAALMVEIDAKWDNLTLVKKAGWKTPKEHPDLDPPHEVLQLVEHYRELRRQESVKRRPQDFQTWLKEAESHCENLETTLRAKNATKTIDTRTADKLYLSLKQSCTQCHGKYRDVPQR